MFTKIRDCLLCLKAPNIAYANRIDLCLCMIFQIVKYWWSADCENEWRKDS